MTKMIKNQGFDRENVQEILALTPMQEGMLFHSLKVPSSRAYFEQLCLDLTGNIQKNVFLAAWKEVIQCNEMLRAVFRWQKLKHPVQVILKHYKLEFHYFDLTKLSMGDMDTRLQKIAQQDRSTGFNFQYVPFRVTLCLIGPNRCRMIISNHHILYDGWSNGVIIKEFFLAYNMHLGKDMTIQISMPKTSFKEFVRWSRDQDIQQHKQFWKNYLMGIDNGAELPIKKNVVQNSGLYDSKGCGKRVLQFPAEQVAQINAFISTNKLTLAALIYAAWGVLLQKYCNNSDVVFGTTISDRSVPLYGIEEMVGLFINTLPVRLQWKKDETSLEAMTRVKKMLTEREEHNGISLIAIKESIPAKGTKELFDSLVVLENYPLDDLRAQRNGALCLESYTIKEETNYDLTVSVSCLGEMEIQFIYSVAAFEEFTISRLTEHFFQIFLSLYQQPGQKVADIDILSDREKKQLIEEFNMTISDYPGDMSIYRLFIQQAQRFPLRVALHSTYRSSGFYVTYGELLKKSEGVARDLREQGIVAGDIVAISMEQSIDMIISILGILKTGAAYLPIATNFPQERIDYILNDSSPATFLTNNDIKGVVSSSFSMNPQQSQDPISSKDAAYIIYTSGSTGRPKGVIVNHKSVINLLTGLQHRFPLNSNDAFLFKTSFAFDVSVTELFGWILGGGGLVVPEPGAEKDPRRLIEMVNQFHITHLNLVPSLFSTFLDALELKGIGDISSLKYLFLAGEVLSPVLVERFRRLGSSASLENLYGPTEATVYASGYSLSDWKGRGSVPIGKPLQNTMLFVVNCFRQFQPVGAPGELCIGGDGLAYGYLNQPLLTSERFTDLELNHEEHKDSKFEQPIYKTGDMARWLPDGNVEFLGRVDRQVKLRGFRIELEEIERCLLGHESVKEAVVVVHKDKDNYLCAYVVMDEKELTGILRDYLTGQLPHYMVPEYYVSLDALPLSGSGKVDHGALPKPELEGKECFIAPRNQTESQLVNIWMEILNYSSNPIGIDDHFFRLGGHSLLAIRLSSAIQKAFDVPFSIAEIFQAPTLRQMAKRVSRRHKKSGGSVSVFEEREYYPLSADQERLFIQQRLAPDSTAYNMPSVYQLQGQYHLGRLESIFQQLISRHESFRTSFIDIDGEPVQRISKECPFKIKLVELSGEGLPSLEQPFDLSQAPLLRVVVANLDQTKHLLMIDMHHIIADGGSIEILVREFRELYANGEVILPGPIARYRDYVLWQKSNDWQQRLELAKDFWLEQFKIGVPTLNLPYDYRRQEKRDFKGDSYSFSISNKEARGLRKLAYDNDTTLFVLLLSLYYTFLAKISGQGDLVVGIGADVREGSNFDGVMGLFVNTLALRCFPSKEKTFLEFLNEVKNIHLKALENRYYPFDKLVESIQGGGVSNRNPLFDVMFQLDSVADLEFNSTDAILKPVPYIRDVSKFDLTLWGYQEGEAINFVLEYSISLFKRETIAQFSFYFKEILSRVLQNSTRPLVEFIRPPALRCSEMLSLWDESLEEEVQSFAHRFPEPVVQEQLQKSFDSNSDRIALQWQDQGFSYRQLAEQVEGVRINLMRNSEGQSPGIFVGVLVSDPFDMILCMLGILNAGCGFVPLDSTLPAQRLAEMIDAVELNVVIVENKFDTSSLPQDLKLLSHAEIMLPSVQANNTVNLNYSPDDTIYIYFTSGSTGTPKAFVGVNKSLVHFIQWEIETLAIPVGTRFSQLVNPGFDAYLRDILVPLCSGGTICLLSGQKDFPKREQSKEIKDQPNSTTSSAISAVKSLNGGKPADLCNQAQQPEVFFNGVQQPAGFFNRVQQHAGLGVRLEKEMVQVVHCVPTVFRQLDEHLTINSLPALNYILLSGEPVTHADLDRWFQVIGERVALLNLWGTSETTMAKSCHQISQKDLKRERIPVGQPISGAQVLVLDEEMNLCDPLVVGELYIRTPFRTLGYYGSAELNRRWFVQSPFNDDPQDLFYKTGDLGRILLDGTIDLLGRIDRQVKIRGARIELTEIENVILRYKGVREAVVIKVGRVVDDEQLQSYVTFDLNVNITDPNEYRCFKEDLILYLGRQLPIYMIPATLVAVATLPRTSNGKIDYEKLSQLQEVIEPENISNSSGFEIDSIEFQLRDIWSQVLGVPVDDIRISSSFFELGGNSLHVMTLIAKIYKQLETRFTLAQLFEHLSIGKQADLIRDTHKVHYRGITPAAPAKNYPLSPAQRRIFFLNQMEPELIAYNMPYALNVQGNLDMVKLESVFQQLVARHEAFRTSFYLENNKPVQRIDQELEFHVNRFAGDICSFIIPFDLSAPPLLRVGVSSLAEESYILVIDMHHIISDGVSMGLLIKDFSHLYVGQETNTPVIAYKDYAVWYNEELQGDQLKKQEQYWLNRFPEKLPVLELPQDFSRPLVQRFEGDRIHFSIDDLVLAQLKRLASQEGVTLYMILMAIYSLFLSRISGGQEDIIIGTPVAGRRMEETHSIIGMFVNTLPIRTMPGGKKSFLSYLREVKKTSQEAFENQDYPFETLVEKLQVNRDTGRNPVFDNLFALQNMDIPELKLPDLTIEPIEFHHYRALFDLSLMTEEVCGQLDAMFEYNCQLFSRQTIERFTLYFKQLLLSILAAPESRLQEMNIIPLDQWNRLLYEFNNTSSQYPSDKSIHQLFIEQTDRSPDVIALHGADETYLTYGELHKQSDCLAINLSQQGIIPGNIVALSMASSIDLIINIIGTLKVGAVYLPIDPNYPQERIDYIIKDSNSATLITCQKGRNAAFCAHSREPQYQLQHNANHPAYIVYTSGSTGRPKGVMVPHCAVIRLVKETNYIDFSSGDRILQTGAISFDASTFEIWGVLLNGLSLYLTHNDLLLSAENMKSMIDCFDIGIMWLTSGLFNQLSGIDVAIFNRLKVLLVGGDVLSPAKINRVREAYPGLKIINGYGPTENTTFSTTYSIERNYSSNIPIGKPIANSSVYILDRQLQLVPISVTGQICVGGDGLALGYLNNPVLTSERFAWFELNHPEDQEHQGSKLHPIYKTGDLGRWLPDGNIEFLGRIDRQVKIRGYRIELGEIEQQLLKIPAINDTVVVARAGDHEGVLCAYYVSQYDLEPETVKTDLSRCLPGYMVPSFLEQIDEIPVTANGKVDRNALPNISVALSKGYIAPKTTIQDQLVQIWADILGIDSEGIGIRDNFFQLGGHSLKAVALIARIHRELGVKVPLSELFQAPFIIALADIVGQGKGDAYKGILPLEEKDYYPMTSSQVRLYYLHQQDPQRVAYNMPVALNVEGNINLEKLQKIFRQLVARHEVFRTSFYIRDSQPVQHVIDVEGVSFGISMVDLSSLVASGLRDCIADFVRPFDLEKPPLLRVTLGTLSPGTSLLIVDMHHIISDGLSFGIFIREFIALYETKELMPLKVQYRDYAAWKQASQQQQYLEKSGEYWLSQFKGDIPVLDLPTDFARPDHYQIEGERLLFHIEKDQSDGLRQLALDEGQTLFILLLALFSVTLSRISGNEDLVIGTVSGGRNHSDLEDIMGIFVNTLVMRHFPKIGMSLREFILTVGKQTLEAFQHQDYPFEQLVEQLKLDPRQIRNPLFDVYFDMQNLDLPELDVPGLKITAYDFKFDITKFDLSFTAVEQGDKIEFVVIFRSDLFKQETVEMFIRYYRRCIQLVLEDPEIRLGDIHLSHQSDRQTMQEQFNEDLEDE
jgi:tyrocidine synthetase III